MAGLLAGRSALVTGAGNGIGAAIGGRALAPAGDVGASAHRAHAAEFSAIRAIQRLALELALGEIR